MSTSDAAAGLAAALSALQGAAAALAAPAGLLLGTVQDDLHDDKRLGTRAGAKTIEAYWNRAEPVRGQPDAAYLRTLALQVDAAHAAGLQAVVDPGWQYPPAWVWSLPGAVFRCQHGHSWRQPADSGQDVPDAVHSEPVRVAQQAYAKTLLTALSKADAVRVGGLLTGEVRYPGDVEKGSLCLWDSRTDKSRPEHIERYLNDIAAYHRAMLEAVHEYAPAARLYALYPSYGTRGNDVENAKLSPPQGNYGEVLAGVDYPRLLDAAVASKAPFTAYSTWFDAPQYGGLAPIEYLAQLCQPRGIPTGGENTESSRSDAAVYVMCRQRAAALGCSAFFWFSSANLMTFPST